MTRIKCAIYVRKSTEKGLEQEFNSLNNQEDACKAYILSQAFNNWEYCKTYEDGGISGGTMKRPALQEMLDDIERGNIDVVVVYKLDRLSRSILDFHNMMKVFDKYGCNFVSITQAFDTSNSMGKLTLNMLLSFAQFEREISSERVRDKIYNSKKKGLWVGGVTPFGYDVIDKKLVPNKKEAEQLKALFEEYLNCKSLQKLKEFAKANNIKSKQWKNKEGVVKGGANLTTGMISRYLRNKTFIGKTVHIKSGEVFNGEHKAIISKDLFNKVREVLDSNKNYAERKFLKYKYPLNKKIFDKDGNVFSNQQSAKNSIRKYRYYKTKGFSLPAGDVENIIDEALQNMFNSNLDNLLKKEDVLVVKSVAWDDLSEDKKQAMVRDIIEKIIYVEGRLNCYVNIENIGRLNDYKAVNYFNEQNKTVDENIYLSSDKNHIIIEKEVYINNRTSTNKYTAMGRRF